MPVLLMLSPAPVIEAPKREVILDVNFVEGMKLHCQFWPGRVCCVLRRGAREISGGMRFSQRRLGFDLITLDPDEEVPEVLIDEASLVYCSADDMRYLSLAEKMRGRLARLVYTLESAPAARLGGVLADPQRAFGYRLRSALWLMRKEPLLSAALSAADGVHLNGFPAYRAYRALNRNSLMYLENRIRTPMLARSADQQARADHLHSQSPLRLVHVGPLEPATGVMDLLQAAYLLKARGVAFRLELFGEGSLAGRLGDGIAALGLSDRVTLAGNPAFETALAPYLRRQADVLLSARRLGDPASIYIEAMGCGLPVLGYANAMWRRLFRESDGGWLCRRGSVSALAQAVARLDGERATIIRASARALAYARAHTFETVFARRMEHLRAVARLD